MPKELQFADPGIRVKRVQELFKGASPMTVVERRKSPRYIVRVDVEVEWRSKTLRVPISDISLGGMFITTSEPLSVGAEFTARVLLEEPLHVHCVVRQVVLGRGMGVQFLDLTDSSRAKLEKFLETLAEK